MIQYDSSHISPFFSVRGSVVPKACMLALPSAILGFVFKMVEQHGYLDLQILAWLSQGSVYGGFTFVLGFTLVFRTSQAYNRYISAAHSVYSMGSEWVDACGSLIAFARASKKPAAEVNEFAHTVVRLFSLLHATALEEIAVLEDENFPLVDIKGLSSEHLNTLTNMSVAGNRSHVVLNWIKALILKSSKAGILDVPPPILTRVFQELGGGLALFYKAQQITIWPFPFPYAQINFLMLVLYMLFTPVVLCAWDSSPVSVAIAALISVSSMNAIEMIAMELENPFGDDANDLPTFEIQHHVNNELLLLLLPQTWEPPYLSADATLDIEELVASAADSTLSLEQYQNRARDGFFKSKGLMEKQKDWAKLKTHGSTTTVLSTLSSRPRPDSIGITVADGADTPSSAIPQSAKQEDACGAAPAAHAPEENSTQDSLDKLSQGLRQVMEEQLQHMNGLLDRQLVALESLVQRDRACAHPQISAWSKRNCLAGSDGGTDLRLDLPVSHV